MPICTSSAFAVRICTCGLLCMLWLAARAGAEQNNALTFRIEVSQPQYERTGGTWICVAAQLLHDKCRGTVPLVMFGEHMRATIEIAIMPPSDEKFFELRASLDGVR